MVDFSQRDWDIMAHGSFIGIVFSFYRVKGRLGSAISLFIVESEVVGLSQSLCIKK